MNLSTVTHSIRAGRYQVKPRGLAVNHRPFLSLMPRPNMPGHFVCGINGREVGREIGSTVLGRVELAGSDELWRTLGPIPAVLFERVCLLLSLDGISQDVLRQVLVRGIVASKLVATQAAEHLALPVPSGITDHEGRLVDVAPLRRRGQPLARRVGKTRLRRRLIWW